MIRPAVEAWLVGKTKLDAAAAAHRGGHRRRPVATARPDVIADPHVARAPHARRDAPHRRRRPSPILVPGNPVKMSKVAEGPETACPWVGEHTDDVLRDELGLDDSELAKLRDAGVIT